MSSDKKNPDSVVSKAIGKVQDALQAKVKRQPTQALTPMASHLIQQEKKEAKSQEDKALLIRDTVRQLKPLIKRYDSLHSMQEYDLRVYTPNQSLQSKAAFNHIFEMTWVTGHYKHFTLFEILQCIQLALLEILQDEAKGNEEVRYQMQETAQIHNWERELSALPDVSDVSKDLKLSSQLPPPVKVGKPTHSTGYGLNADSQGAIDSFHKARQHLEAIPGAKTEAAVRLPSDSTVRQPKTVATPRHKPDLSFKTEED